MESQHFSVVMSVYRNDNPEYFGIAVNSILNQTCPPDEIVLIVDGPIPETLQVMVDSLSKNIRCMKVIPLAENMGHAAARQTGLDNVANELVAIMDADDISTPNRFEKLLSAFADHPEVSVVGGLINEFIGDTDNVVGRRIVPETDSEIKAYMRSRCPMNLMTVMFKRSDILAVGGFVDWFCEEDYYLWIRLALAGKKFYNIQEDLANVRVGEEMYRRRGGKKYFESEARLQRYLLEQRLISLPKYVCNVMIRWVVQVVMPNGLRGWVFRKFARQ